MLNKKHSAKRVEHGVKMKYPEEKKLKTYNLKHRTQCVFFKLTVTLAVIGIIVSTGIIAAGKKPKNDISDQLDTTANMIYIDPQVKDVKINEEFSLQVSVNNISGLFAVPFYLTYDAKLLQFVSAKEGPFLKQDGNSTIYLFSNDADSGRVIVGLTRLGQVKGVSGSGPLMSINFKAVGAGKAFIGFDNASAKQVIPEDPVPQSLPAIFRGGQVNVK